MTPAMATALMMPFPINPDSFVNVCVLRVMPISLTLVFFLYVSKYHMSTKKPHKTLGSDLDVNDSAYAE